MLTVLIMDRSAVHSWSSTLVSVCLVFWVSKGGVIGVLAGWKKSKFFIVCESSSGTKD